MIKKLSIYLVLFLFFSFIDVFAGFVKDFGTDGIVDYEKYGYFENLNTTNYKYVLLDRKGLGDIQGEGIYPNGWSMFSNPGFISAKNKGLLEGNRWDFTHIDDTSLMYYKWVDSFQENPAVKQFFIAEAFEKGGYIKQAIKAYYSILVFFPKEIGNTYWKTPWYISTVSLDRINFLLDTHKEIQWKLIGANINIKNKFDDIISNDIFYINPGKLVFDKYVKSNQKNIVREKIGKFGNISLIRYRNDHWQLKVNGNPYIVKGVAYSPIPKGENVENSDWSIRDENKNGKIDAPFDSVVNGKSVGDFKLMKDMGVNTIRLYSDISNKKILNILFNDFHIRVMMGIKLNFLDNSDLSSRYELNVKEIKFIENIIKKHKDESYLLFWCLGNEDNYSVNIKYVTNYYRKLNAIAKVIKKIDNAHPIIICNGDLLYLDAFVKECQNIDIFGANVYRGEYGIGYSFWNDLKKYWNRPVIITEYGCPSLKNSNLKSSKDSEQKQFNYHKNCWEDIKNNSFLNSDGFGLSLGGIAFEWLDEWWKAGFDNSQDLEAQWAGPFPDGWMYEEFLGICGQGEIEDNELTRKLKKVYYFYKKVWN